MQFTYIIINHILEEHQVCPQHGCAHDYPVELLDPSDPKTASTITRKLMCWSVSGCNWPTKPPKFKPFLNPTAMASRMDFLGKLAWIAQVNRSGVVKTAEECWGNQAGWHNSTCLCPVTWDSPTQKSQDITSIAHLNQKQPHSLEQASFCAQLHQYARECKSAVH